MGSNSTSSGASAGMPSDADLASLLESMSVLADTNANDDDASEGRAAFVVGSGERGAGEEGARERERERARKQSEIESERKGENEREKEHAREANRRTKIEIYI